VRPGVVPLVERARVAHGRPCGHDHPVKFVIIIVLVVVVLILIGRMSSGGGKRK
jgi:hypothetical protein